MQKTDGDWRAFIQNLPVQALLWVAMRMPYERRVVFMGHVVSRIVAPLARWDRRIARNLEIACPDLPPSEIRRLQRAVPDNAGRTLIESYSGGEFIARAKNASMSGAGLAPFREARAQGRPVILVTAHFGNYFSARAALQAEGHTMAALYRPMRNAWFNRHYVAAITKVGEPLFPDDRKGVLGLVRHLSHGGIIAIVADVHVVDGARLKFFGRPAKTSLSAAEWALKYNALMIPAYGIREPDGFSFRVLLDAPIPKGTPAEMSQAVNDSLEAQVRLEMHQWFWIHRRWSKKKSRRQVAREAGGKS